MLDALLSVALPVLTLFVLMAVGFASAKFKWIDGAGSRQMAAILLYICTPCIILRSFESLEFTPETLTGLLWAGGFAVVTHVVGIIPSFFLFRRDEPSRRGVLRMGVAFSNCAYMGIPVASALLGQEAVAYAAVYIVVFNILCWTYGVQVYRPGQRLRLRSVFVNPGVISLALGLILLFSGIKFPELIGVPMEMLGAVNAPLAMLIAGVYLAGASLLPQKGDGRMWLAIALRLAVTPLVMLCVVLAAGLDGLWADACMILAAAPSAANILLFASLFGGDTVFAARFLAFCNLCSIVTMPLILFFVI